MSTRMIAIQKRAYLAQAEDAASVLAQRLKSVSPGERAGIIATVVKEAEAPLDLILLAEDHTEALDALMMIDGVLSPSASMNNGWRLGGNHLLSIVEVGR